MMHSETGTLHNKSIDRFNQEKLYIQLTRIFLEEIKSGKWQLNQRISSEEELCKKYGVSKVTVRQAVNNLVSDGYLMKLQGKGTFVVSVLPVVGLSMKTQLTEEMFGKEVKVEKEVLFKGIKEPSPDIRSYLRTTDKIYHFLCRRTVNGNPAYLDESFIPYQMLPEIEQLDIINNSLYLVLQDHALKKIFRVVQPIDVQQIQ